MRKTATAHLPWIGPPPLPVQDRPNCLWCAKKLTPRIDLKSDPAAKGILAPYIAREFKGYGYDGCGHLHKLNCAADWARWAVENCQVKPNAK